MGGLLGGGGGGGGVKGMLAYASRERGVTPDDCTHTPRLGTYSKIARKSSVIVILVRKKTSK